MATGSGVESRFEETNAESTLMVRPPTIRHPSIPAWAWSVYELAHVFFRFVCESVAKLVFSFLLFYPHAHVVFSDFAFVCVSVIISVSFRRTCTVFK
jgi:hypothetical protein